MKLVYPGAIASSIAQSLGSWVDQHQGNGTYGVHQLRAQLPGDPQLYRIIVAPAEAPITVNGVPVDRHFSEPLSPLPATVASAAE